MWLRVSLVLAVLISTDGCCRRTHCSLERTRREVARWEFSEEKASAEWCALNRTGPRYAAVLGHSAADQAEGSFEEIFEGPVRISIQENGAERYAWNGFRYSVWDVDQSLLVFARFLGGIPGGWLTAVDLESGGVMWEAPLTHPLPQGWSMWLNRMTIEIRGDRVYAWSLDGGQFLETFDRRTGRSRGWRRCTEH